MVRTNFHPALVSLPILSSRTSSSFWLAYQKISICHAISIGTAIVGSISVSTTTETGTTQGVFDTCPQGQWYCALILTFIVIEVLGIVVSGVDRAGGMQGEDASYTVQMPKLGPDHLLAVSAATCTCGNLKRCADINILRCCVQRTVRFLLKDIHVEWDSIAWVDLISRDVTWTAGGT